MRILFLCQRVPYPPTKGEKIRSYHELAELTKHHEVHLVTLADGQEDEEPVAFLRKQCASVDVVYRSRYTSGLLALGAIPSARPFSVAAFDSGALRRLVAARVLAARPEIAFAYSVAMAQYVEAMTDIPRVVDFVDADSEKYVAYSRVRGFPQSVLFTLEAERLARLEGRLANEFDASIFVSEAEAEIVRRRAPGRELTVLPNGVDLDFFRPPPDAERPRGPQIVFTGVMGYYPNVDAVSYFASEVMPRVLAEVPAARFLIVGRDPTAAVRRLAALSGVVVTGSVPDIRPYLNDAALAVAPFRIARGIQNKVLEAMAAGLPVVGTPLSFQGLAAGEEDGVRMGDSPERLAEVVVRLLRDAGERRECGRRARLYVERHHHWERFGERLEALLSALVAAGRPLLC